jgi:hypothetical protein
MHTQNVNVKTAGEETAGRWGKNQCVLMALSQTFIHVTRSTLFAPMWFWPDGKTGKPWVWAVLRDL